MQTKRFRRLCAVIFTVVVVSVLAMSQPAAAQGSGAFLSGAERWTESDCVGQVPIVVGSDARAQSDIYSAVTLAGVVGTDCLVLAGPRDTGMPDSQRARLRAADAGGYVVGGTAAVPVSKLAGRSLTRVGGSTRWETAQLVGSEARILAGGVGVTHIPSGASLSLAADVLESGAHLAGAEAWFASDCSGEVPIVVGSDARAQSDIYSAVTLAGVVDTSCVILAGRRDGSVPASQRARLRDADSRGYVVGGDVAVPTSKLGGGDFDRLGGATRWSTAQLVGSEARRIGDSTGEPVSSMNHADSFEVSRTSASSVSMGSIISAVTVTVHYCGPPEGRDDEGVWDTQRLRSEASLLQRHVKPFFESQFGDSGYSIDFEAGKLLEPSVATNYWAVTTMADWQDSAAAMVKHAKETDTAVLPSNACESALQDADLEDRNSLILGHIRTHCAAYAWKSTTDYTWASNGSALVGTRLMYDDCSEANDYLTVVAHELGHSVYGLPHPWGKSETKVEGETDGCQSTHRKTGFELGVDELSSIMSYTFPNPPCNRIALGVNAHISCVDRRILEWLSAGECGDSLPLTIPSEPLDVQLVTGDRELRVTWEPPVNNGGSDIDGYLINYKRAGSSGAGNDVIVGASQRSFTLTGLINGITYEVRMRAQNSIGESAQMLPTVGTPTSDVAIVTLSVGISAEGAPTTTPPGGKCSSRCRWLRVDVANVAALGPGPYNVVCAHRGIDGAETHSPGAFGSKQVSSFPTNACAYGYIGTTVYAIVGAERGEGFWYGGQHSNDVVWPNCNTRPQDCQGGPDGDDPDGDDPGNGEELTLTLTVTRGNIKTDNGHCPTVATGCRWVVGSGSNWTAGEQFWIRCGNFVDTSRNRPVTYRDRFVDRNGNLSWGENICYSIGTHEVEVWTASGDRKIVNIQ